MLTYADVKARVLMDECNVSHTGTQFTGFTGTKVQVLTHSVYWLYWYKSTSTDAAAGVFGGIAVRAHGSSLVLSLLALLLYSVYLLYYCTQFTCCTTIRSLLDLLLYSVYLIYYCTQFTCFTTVLS